MTRLNVDLLGPCPEEGASVALITTRLIEAIQDGQLEPGTRIGQQVVADHFKCSRMPVREALRLVQAKGLITYSAHRSLVVAEPVPDPQQRIEQLEAYLIRSKEIFNLMEDSVSSCWMVMARQLNQELSQLLTASH